MKKRQRKGTARKRVRRASPAKPQPRRSAKRGAAPTVAVDADDDVWISPQAAARIPAQRATVDVDDDDVWMPPSLGADERARREAVAVERTASLATAMQTLDLETVQWACRYGCDGMIVTDDGPMYHHYACPFWDREGKTLTPF